MCRKILFLLVLVIGLSAGAAKGAVPIEVENYSFELPGTVKQKCWDGETGSYVDVPGWTDGPDVAGDSGVEPNERGFIPTDGDWGGFLKGSDPPVYNLTNHIIGIGDVYELQIDIGGNGSAVVFQLALFYDDDGTRVIVASNDLEVPDRRNTTKLPYSLSFTASDDPNCYNHRIGIQLDNSTNWAGFDYVRLSLVEPVLRAINLNPALGVTVGTDVTLSWRAGDTADKHHLYLGENFDDVKNGTGGTDKGLIDPNNYQPQDLVNGKTYYWRIDEVEVDGTTVHPGVVWNFSVAQKNASNPVPANDAVLVDPNVTLSWSAGSGAISRDVYFGTVSPPPLISPGQTTTTYDPSGDLEYETTYYWRIDEFDGTNTYPGDLWSFTTIREIPITDPNLVGWWSFDEDEEAIAVDVSGYGNHGDIRGEPNYVAGYDANAMEFDGVDDYVAVTRMVQDDFTLMAWIKTDQPGAGQIGNTAREGSGLLWSGAAAATSDFFLLAMLDTKLAFRIGTANVTSNGDVVTGDWTHVAVTRTQSTGQVELFINSSIDTTAVMGTGSLTDNPAIVIGTNLLDKWYYTGLIDDVRIYDKALTAEEIGVAISPPTAWGPNPSNGATDVKRTLTLTWKLGSDAVSHIVYFDPDAQKVMDRSGCVVNGVSTTDPCYPITTELDLGRIYYWVVDEVNGLDVWPGNVWSFTTADYLFVDDFEEYDDSEDLIYLTWVDGYGSPGNDIQGNGTGSTIGHKDPSYAETIIVHDGLQSMPMDYNNTDAPYYSQADRTWDTPQDWTREGVSSLTLWLQGYRESVGGISYNATTQEYTMTGSGTDIWDLTDPRQTGFHDEFHFAYKELHGYEEAVITARVHRVTNTNEWAKAGVMIRQSLDADSPYVMVCVTPGQGVAFQYRENIGDATTRVQDTNIAPHWVRLTLNQDTFAAYHSEDGENWSSIGEEDPALFWMTENKYIGLALTSCDPDLTCEAVFSHVSTTGNVSPTGPFTTSQDIGILSNDAESLYVTLKDNNGNSHLVEHHEPSATQMYPWGEWNIDLREFSSEGVNLGAIKQMSIGAGDPEATSPSGKGKIYIDDIRLYRSRCVPELIKPAGDFSNNCVVDYPDLQTIINNWLISGGYDVIPEAPSDANLVAFYEFNGNFNDSHNGYHGEPNGASIVTDPTRGQVASFDGDDYVAINNSTNLPVWTVSVWVKSPIAPDVGTEETRGGPVHRGLNYQINWDHTDPDFRGAAGIRVGETWYDASFGTLEADTWYHLAATYDGEILVAYKDGVLTARNTDPSGSPSDEDATLELGRGDGYFFGTIDNVHLYNRALSQNEVAWLAGKTTEFTQPLDVLLTPQDPSIDINSDNTINMKDYSKLASMWLEEQLWPQL